MAGEVSLLAASPVIAAIDTPRLDRALALAAGLAPVCGMLKLGLEFFVAQGPDGVEAVTRQCGDSAADTWPLFLDLKLHDIPNTVAGAVRSVRPLRPRMLTLHASGGAAMIAAARDAAEAGGGPRPLLLAVTVLTSLDAADLRATGIADTPQDQVLRLARLALDAGADGLVCSPHEVAALRRAFGRQPVLVVPGIRPQASAAGDQARVMTPGEAMAAGADWIVIGRPLTKAADPAAAARAIQDSLARR